MGLAALRKKAKLTLKELAKISGVNYQKIWQIEHDVIKPEHIMLRTAKRLADALNCTPEDLLAPDEPEEGEEETLDEEKPANESEAAEVSAPEDNESAPNDA